MNGKKIALLLGMMTIGLTGCNDTTIYHQYVSPFLRIVYDWSLGELPDADDQVTLVVTGTHENQTIVRTPVTGTDMQLWMDDYRIVAVNPPEGVSYDNGYTVGVDEVDGWAAEPVAPFGAGETEVTVVKNVTPGKRQIEMIPQTRMLIVEIVFGDAAGHDLEEAGRFKATLNGVTVSRDIANAFPPQTVTRPTGPSAYADFLLAFERVEGGTAGDLTFRAAHRLLGLGAGQKNLVLEYYEGDVPVSQPVFLTLEEIDLDGFHTATPVKEPFKVRIGLVLDGVDGAWTIVNWETGTGDDLIAIEQ